MNNLCSCNFKHFKWEVNSNIFRKCIFIYIF